MDLTAQLSNEIKQLAGFSSSTPRRVEITDAAGLKLSIGFVAVDTMSSAFAALSLHVPKLVGHESAVLNDWADNLSQRVTYLLENLGTIEIDSSGSQVLIRSTPPQQVQGSNQYYEILLSALVDGTFELKRYRTDAGQVGREAVDVQLTNETLKKLVNDLVDTIPEVD